MTDLESRLRTDAAASAAADPPPPALDLTLRAAIAARRSVWPAAAAVVLLVAGVLVAVLAFRGGGSGQPATQPYPSTIVRDGIAYQARRTFIPDASVDPTDPRLLYVFVLDESHGSDAKCRGQYPTVAVVRQTARSVTLRAADYVEKSALPPSGSYDCYGVVDGLVRLSVGIDAPLGTRVLRDEAGNRRIHRIDPATECNGLAACHP